MTGWMVSGFARDRWRVLMHLSSAGAVCLGVNVLVWVALCAHDSHALSQYLMTIKVVAGRPFADSLRAIRPYWTEWGLEALFLVFGLLVTVSKPGLERWLKFWAGPLCGLAIISKSNLWQLYYVLFYAPYFLVNLADFLVSGSRGQRRLALTGVALVFALAARVASLSMRMALPQMLFPAESQFQNYLADVRSRIPAGSTVIIGEESLWFALADNCKVWDMGVPDRDQAQKVTHVVLTGKLETDPAKFLKSVPLVVLEAFQRHEFRLVFSSKAKDLVSGRPYAIWERAPGS